VLSPAERTAVPDAELAGEAEALIKEARRRRRRRWIRGTGAVLLAAGGVTTWLLLEPPGSEPHAASVTASGPATAGSCASSVVYGSLPPWARTGFTPPDVAMPHVLSAHGDIVAVLWARHDALVTPTPPGRNNKILWVPKVWDAVGSNLQITAQRLVGGTAVGPVQHRTLVGVGPSIVDMPTPGCWQFTLRWGQHTDTVDLPYSAG